MALKNVTGTGGVATIAGFTLQIKAFAAQLAIRDVDISAISDTADKFDPTTAVCTGTIVAHVDDAAALWPVDGSDYPDVPDFRAAIVLTFETACTWTFTAIVTQCAITRDREQAMVTLSFQSVSTVVQAWDETP